MPTETKTKSRIRICADCQKVPARGIRSKRCVECHEKHLKEKTRRWNAIRAEKARENYTPTCEHPDCDQPKRNELLATKWCEKHLHEMRVQYGREYRQRRREHRIANPGRCQNPGCTSDSYSYKAKYCTPCRKELRNAQNAVYRQDRMAEHDAKNVQVIQYVAQRLNEVVNGAAKGESLDTPECHRMGTVLLQLRAWGSIK